MFLLSTVGSVQAATTYWTLVPKQDPRAEVGKFTVLGGNTSPEGVHFSLPDTTINNPVVITLVSLDPEKELMLKAFKDQPPQALFTGITDVKGMAVCKYRSGEKMSFQVTGEAGVGYQLSAWVGPEILLPPPLPVVSMITIIPDSGLETESPAVGSASRSATDPENGIDHATSSSSLNPLVYILLGGIFLVLVVIVVLMFRGQIIRSKASLLFLFLTLGVAPVGVAEVQESFDLRPSLKEDGKEDKRIAAKLQSDIDGWKKISGLFEKAKGVDFDSPMDLTRLKQRGLTNSAGNVSDVLQTALNLLEAFDVIDPRENFIQPDYNPKGLPALPTRALDDYSIGPKRSAAFRALQDRINDAKAHLEKNYVVMKQTELSTNRLIDLADTAGGFSGIGGLKWATMKGDPNEPMNKSKVIFYKTYDGGQEKGLKYLDSALKDFSEFEIKHYGDRNWYLYFGLPYYNFMVARYTRPGA